VTETVPPAAAGARADISEDADSPAALVDAAVEHITGDPVDLGSSADETEKTDETDASSPLDILEREGDIGGDYLEELLDIADLDGDIDLDVDGDRAIVSLVGGDLGHLVGDDGAVLTALQDLTRLAVTRETGQRSRLVVDVDGYRARRRSEIAGLVATAAEQVRTGGGAVPLPSMGAFERKIAHDAVAGLGLASESEGDEPRRRVVVRAA
jgi:spoIIIJ-associated protein